MHDIHCVCTRAGDVYSATIEHKRGWIDTLVNRLQCWMSIEGRRLIVWTGMGYCWVRSSSIVAD